jgi:hypothetical protein
MPVDRYLAESPAEAIQSVELGELALHGEHKPLEKSLPHSLPFLKDRDDTRCQG